MSHNSVVKLVGENDHLTAMSDFLFLYFVMHDCHAFQEHIYKLMKSDSYSRFIRSSAYQELLQAKKKVTKFTTGMGILKLSNSTSQYERGGGYLVLVNAVFS